MVTFQLFSSGTSGRSEREAPSIIWMRNAAVLPLQRCDCSTTVIGGRRNNNGYLIHHQYMNNAHFEPGAGGDCDSDSETSYSDMPTLIGDGEGLDEDEVERPQRWLAEEMETRQQRQEAHPRTRNIATTRMYNINENSSRSSSPVSVVRETETSVRGEFVPDAFVRDDRRLGGGSSTAGLHPPYSTHQDASYVLEPVPRGVEATVRGACVQAGSDGVVCISVVKMHPSYTYRRHHDSSTIF